MRKKSYTLEKQGYISLANEYEQHTYLSFDRQKKEMTVISDGQKAYALGDMLIDFITLDDDILNLYEQDRLQLIEDLHLIDADAFNWDFRGTLDEFTENYLTKNNISKDEFAKKLAIIELLRQFEHQHPYFSMLNLYTAILPYDNTILLTHTLNLKALKAKLTEMAVFCLDTEAEHLSKLSAEKRYYFYHASGRGSIPQGFQTRVVVLPNKIPLKDYSVFYKTLPKDFDVSKIWELSSMHELKEPQEVTADTAAYLNDSDIRIYEAYEARGIADMAYLEFYQMLLANAAIKKCSLCGRYFAMKGDYSTKYCDRKARGRKQTCQQLGSSRDFRSRTAESPVKVEYLKAYKRMHSRIKYGIITKEKFNEWNDAAKDKASLCERGGISLDDLIKFLGN